MTTMKTEMFKSKAYSLFISELAADIDESKKKFFNGEILNDKSFRDSANSFHRIKGAAGFFGLIDVSSCAAELERVFKRSLEEIVCDMDRVRDLISQMEKHYTLLPTASTEEQKDRDNA